MECPKCGLVIDDKTMVCPNCKKVLKLSCPICKTINESNTCKKCGYVIISKCHECGKVNQTASKKCKKCGFDTEKSVIMNESNNDDFVMMTIDFPNLDEMKSLLGSAKLFNKFKINLDKIIFDYVKSQGLRRQLIDKTYVIRFNKDYTFNGSAANAMKSAIEILNRITAMNCKLSNKKNASVRCNVFLLKRSVDDDPNNYKSGFNISLINQKSESQEEKILNTFQILADDFVVDSIDGDYITSPLNSVLVGDTMMMFHEVDVKEFVKVEFPVEDDDEIQIPNFVQNMLVEQDKLDGEALSKLNSNAKDPDALYDVDSINFEEINCEFIRSENIDSLFHISNKFQSCPKGIVAMKTMELHKPYSIKVLNTVAELGLFNNVITVTCYDEMKYEPYSFFRDLISTIFEYTVSQKLFFQNDFSMFASVDPDGLIRDLITLQKREAANAEDTRLVYFDIFMTLLQIIPKTLIFIEDFHKIDESSYDVLKFILNSFEELDISILISYDKNFSLHKDCHFLLTKPYYTEITLKPTTFEKLIENNKVYFKDILNNFYFQRIAKYSYGSSLFIDYAIQYLIECGVYAADNDSIKMINPKTIIIPSSLDKLIARRINILQDDAVALKFLSTIVLLGTRVDMETVMSLGFDKPRDIIERLSNMGYIYEYNNCIYFPNYNLLRRNLIGTLSKIYLQDIAQHLLSKVYNDADMPSTIEAYLYNIIGDKDNEIKQWEELADVNLSLGDFSAYINCAGKILEFLNENEDVEQAEQIEQYRAYIYENISNNLYEYIPEKTSKIAEETLFNIEKNGDVDKIIQLCNKMIDGALRSGNYSHALELIHKVLSILPPSSLNPLDPNFNTYFFLMSLIHIRVLFNIGALEDCIDIGFKVLNILNDSTMPMLKPDYFSPEDFELLVLDAIGFVALAAVIHGGTNIAEIMSIIGQSLSFMPKSYSLFITIDELIKGNRQIPLDTVEIAENDKFGETLFNLICAFMNLDNDYNIFVDYIYKAKLAAHRAELYQLELFADIMVGYAYLLAKSYDKAEHIIYNIIKETDTKGMLVLLYISWYVMAEIHLRQQQYDVAYGIVNNSLIQLEKNNNTSEYILLLFKYIMFKIMMYKEQFDKADICISHAKYIANKYGLEFNFDTDPSHYMNVIDSFDGAIIEEE